MLYNYFKIAFRSIVKFKGFTIINLIGLALGLTAGMLIMVYVLDECSFDRFHSKADRLYRVTTVFQTAESASGGVNSTNGWPVGKILENDFPEVEAVLYTRSASYLLVNKEDKRIRENIHYATPEFFRMFSFPLLSGNSEKVLQKPYSVVISRNMALKYFGSTDVLNKSLVMADTLNVSITGVMENLPHNSHIQADMILSFATYQKMQSSFSFDAGWGNINMRNYVLLRAGSDFKSFEAKSRNIYMDRAGEMLKNWGVSAYVGYEPMNEIYLYSKSGNGMGPLGSMDRLYLMGGIALFVILLACINFINLATARSVYRAREVGLRKAMGSSRAGLIWQFLSESFIITVLSFLIAILITLLLLPFFNLLLDKHYELSTFTDAGVIAGIVLLIAIISLLAGYYPAMVLSALRPVEVLKGKLQSSPRGVQLRRSLVVFQFVISISLVTGTLVVIDQLKFMQHQQLGFAKEEVFVINAARVSSPNPQAFQTFKNEVKKIPMVREVSFNNAVPGVPGWQGQVAYPENKTADDAVSVEYMAVDADYLPSLDIALIAGRNFDEQRDSDRKEGLIINEVAMAMMGWTTAEEAIGKKITSPSGYPAGEVIGVVKNYHNLGLQQKIGPVVMDYNPESSYLYAVRFTASDTQQLVEQLTLTWKAYFPGYDFNFFFLDENFEKQYQTEERLTNVFVMFAALTMLIASIGLIGLVSFMVTARTKEIGVRKVLGANELSVVKLLSKEFILLVIIANLISIPLTWYFTQEWLKGFAYRMKMDPMIFVWTLVIALVITMISVSGQTIKAALANPVKALRYE